MLARGASAVRLTEDHKPNLEHEKCVLSELACSGSCSLWTPECCMCSARLELCTCSCKHACRHHIHCTALSRSVSASAVLGSTAYLPEASLGRERPLGADCTELSSLLLAHCIQAAELQLETATSSWSASHGRLGRRARIVKQGGSVEFASCWRVICPARNTGLAVSRALGDIDFKEPDRWGSPSLNPAGEDPRQCKLPLSCPQLGAGSALPRWTGCSSDAVVPYRQSAAGA